MLVRFGRELKGVADGPNKARKGKGQPPKCTRNRVSFKGAAKMLTQ